MIDTFKLHPEFIEVDNRKNRPIIVPSPEKNGPSYSYNINPEFMFKRHQVMLPLDLIKGKSILDIGGCIGASGDWSLANGAKHYTNIEFYPECQELSKTLLSKYYSQNQYSVYDGSFSDFPIDKKYDIVVAAGTLYGSFDVFKFVEKMTKLSNEFVIIDAVHPFNGYRRLFPDASDADRKRVSQTLSIIQPSERIRQGIQSNKSLRVAASLVSITALKTMMKNHGFEYDESMYNQAELEIPEIYNVINHNRYLAKFFISNTKLVHLESEIKNPDANNAWVWK
jgi:hypothetical protein